MTNGTGDARTVTGVLRDVQRGSPDEREKLFAVVYGELKRIATASMRRQPGDHTLQPTALAHEAWLRLTGREAPEWRDRAHFFRAAARAMRSVLVDFARRRAARKRGGSWQRVACDGLARAGPSDEVVAVHEALARLERIDPERSRIVELRFFCGLSVEETAAVLGVTTRTVYRAWDHARAWLFREIHR